MARIAHTVTTQDNSCHSSYSIHKLLSFDSYVNRGSYSVATEKHLRLCHHLEPTFSNHVSRAISS